MPDTIRGIGAFSVEHYKPKGRFPKNACDYSNLFYSCSQCNSFKGEFWPKPSDRALGSVIPNPCDDVMAHHLRYRGAKISSLSRTGTFTLDLLELDDSETETLRDTILFAVAADEDEMKVWRRSIQLAEKALAKATAGARPVIEKDIATYRTKAARAQARLAVLQGL
jgi:hypothetical protein